MNKSPCPQCGKIRQSNKTIPLELKLFNDPPAQWRLFHCSDCAFDWRRHEETANKTGQLKLI